MEPLGDLAIAQEDAWRAYNLLKAYDDQTTLLWFVSSATKEELSTRWDSKMREVCERVGGRWAKVVHGLKWQLEQMFEGQKKQDSFFSKERRSPWEISFGNRFFPVWR